MGPQSAGGAAVWKSRAGRGEARFSERWAGAGLRCRLVVVAAGGGGHCSCSECSGAAGGLHSKG